MNYPGRGTHRRFSTRRSWSARTVWALLVTLTCLAWLAGGAESDLGRGVAGRAVGVGVLLIAVVKVRLVGRHFMEIRTAPRWLQLTFDGYCGALFTVLSVLFVLD